MEQKEIFHDITELVETGEHKLANDYLVLGWRLLNVGNRRSDEYECSRYILGWPNPLPAKRPASKKGD